MKCPHCRTDFHDNVSSVDLGRDKDGFWYVERQQCPACLGFVLTMVNKQANRLSGDGFYPAEEKVRYLARPKAANRPAPPTEVPEQFARDYREASVVLADSAMASAALSRRCLQHILREHVGVKKADLSKEIQEVIDSGKLPSHLADAIDAVRNIGNFAAHPIKATASGEVLPVEPGEAEWTLDVLDGLFDFLFVQPTALKRKRDALNAKLAAASKPPVK